MAAKYPEVTQADIDYLFSDVSSRYTPPMKWPGSSTAPEVDDVLLASERARCSCAPSGRLLLAHTGLYFVPGLPVDSSTANVVPWLGRALTDEDERSPDHTDRFSQLRGRSPAEQVAGVPGSIHLPVEALAGATFTTIDHGVETVVDGHTYVTYTGGPYQTLEIGVPLPSGATLTFTLPDPPPEPLAAWRAAIGHSP